MYQKFSYGVSAALIGAAIALQHPIVAVAQTLDDQAIASQAKEVTVVINGQNPGSGVIIGKNGNTYSVLTAKHVVATPDEYQIVTSDGVQHVLDYRNVTKLPDVDLAVVQFTSNQSYPLAEMSDSDAATEGATIYISGWPHPGQAISQRIFQITPGKVSGRSLGAAEDGYEIVYTNITQSGMSGGPVFDAKGRLIGIHGRAEGQAIFNPDTGDTVAVKSGFNLGIPINIFYKQAKPTELPQNPSLVSVLLTKGGESHKQNRLPEAKAYYEKVLGLDPQNLAVTINIGSIEYEMGDVEAAIEHWQRVVEIDPKKAEPQLAIAVALYARGDRQRGLTMATTALQLSPSLGESTQLESRLWGERLVTDARLMLAYFRPAKTVEFDWDPWKKRLHSVAFSFESRIGASSYEGSSGSGDFGNITLWDLATGKELRTLTGHSYPVDALAISPDGKLLASGSRDGTIKLWDLPSGKELRKLEHSSLYDVRALAISPDGKLLASGGIGGILKLWDLASGQELRTLTGHLGGVNALAFSPDGRILASRTGNGNTKLWDPTTGTELRTLKEFKRASEVDAHFDVAFSPDGKLIAGNIITDSGKAAIKLLNVNTGEELHTFTGIFSSISCFAFSPDGQTLAVGDGKYLHLLDVGNRLERHFFIFGDLDCESLAFNADGQTLITVDDSQIGMWQMPER